MTCTAAVTWRSRAVYADEAGTGVDDNYRKQLAAASIRATTTARTREALPGTRTLINACPVDVLWRWRSARVSFPSAAAARRSLGRPSGGRRAAPPPLFRCRCRSSHRRRHGWRTGAAAAGPGAFCSPTIGLRSLAVPHRSAVSCDGARRNTVDLGPGLKVAGGRK